jgi:hypothetical protein
VSKAQAVSLTQGYGRVALADQHALAWVSCADSVVAIHLVFQPAAHVKRISRFVREIAGVAPRCCCCLVLLLLQVLQTALNVHCLLLFDHESNTRVTVATSGGTSTCG